MSHEAVVEIEELVAEAQCLAQQIEDLFRTNFPSLHEQGKAYDAFNLTGSWNRFDTTVESLLEAAAEWEEEEA